MAQTPGAYSSTGTHGTTAEAAGGLLLVRSSLGANININYGRDARVTARGPDPARLYVTSGPRVIRGEYIFSFYFFQIFQILFFSNFRWNPSVGLLLLPASAAAAPVALIEMSLSTDS